jgi:hypothetical protein
MEKYRMEQKKELLGEMVKKISEVMDIMDRFENSRPGSLAFTHLEEGLMWLNVMANNVALKNTGN